jgi:hypothetical protein
MPACAHRILTPGYVVSIASTVASSMWHQSMICRRAASSAKRLSVGAATSLTPKCDSPIAR